MDNIQLYDVTVTLFGYPITFEVVASSVEEAQSKVWRYSLLEVLQRVHLQDLPHAIHIESRNA